MADELPPPPQLAAPFMQSIQRQQRRSSLSRRTRAFTMIELVIVLLIISMLTAVAAPTFLDSLLFHRVESAARRVKSDLELIRSQARLTSAGQSITFTNSSYTLVGVTSLDKPSSVYTVDLSKEPFALSSATANFGGDTTVSFDGYGTPSSGGTVVLTAKSHQRTVSLNATSGEVTVSPDLDGRTAQMPGS